MQGNQGEEEMTNSRIYPKKLMEKAMAKMTTKPQPIWCGDNFWPDGYEAGYKPTFKSTYKDEKGKKFSVCYASKQIAIQVATFGLFSPFSPLGNSTGSNDIWYSRPNWGDRVLKMTKAQVRAKTKKIRDGAIAYNALMKKNPRSPRFHH
jgi:hypothetical protein